MCIHFAGFDVCPAEEVSKYELHVNGDIAFAVQQYISATWDKQFLAKEKGWELVTGLADFWASRSEYDESKKAYGIKSKSYKQTSIFISSQPISSYLFLSHLVSSHLISSQLNSSRLVLSRPVPSHLVSSILVAFHPAPFFLSCCLISSHLASSYHVSLLFLS